MKEIKKDITIVGGGVTGLMLTKKFSDLGYDVALIEKKSVLGGGPSTKNEGWLHRGTYHAISIKDEIQALAVARRCMYGHDQWRKFAPEAVEDIGAQSYALVKSDEEAQRVTDRWDKAGVGYRPLRLSTFSELNPDIDITPAHEAFAVDDVSINTRLLYQKLAAQSRKNGADIFLSSTIHPESDGKTRLITPDGEGKILQSDKLIVTTGYGIGDIYKDLTGDDLPVRYWKSHLVVIPRVTQNNVFYLAKGEAALFNHGRNSVVGIHEDAQIQDTANFDVVPDRERLVFDATVRLAPDAAKYESAYLPVACIKPDVAKAGKGRCLDVDVFENQGVIFALPGKMTEAPYVADILVQQIFEDSPKLGQVALRPTDRY